MTRTLLSTTLLALAACGNGASNSEPAAAGQCSQDLPSACPASPPSYAASIAPLLKDRCQRCHAPGGTAGGILDLTSYPAIDRNRQSILSRVYACQMPPLGAPSLDEEQRSQLLTWLVCDAPNN